VRRIGPLGRLVTPWVKPWLAPWPWVSLGLLLLCLRTEPPRLWFWLALLLISLLVGLLRALAKER
jgi:hypothetical protein